MVLLFVLLLCLLADSHATTNLKKTDSCPSSIIRWGNRESMFACPAKTPYHCILMYNSSQLYEGCMASVTIEPEEEGCPWILIHKDPACFLPRSERNPAIPDSTTSRPITVNMQKTSSPPTENGVNAILISVLVIVAIVGVVAIVVLVVVLKRKKGDTKKESSTSIEKDNTRGLKGSNEIDESDKENKKHHTPSAKDTQKESSTSNEKDDTRGLKDESMHRVATSMETGNSVPDVTLGKRTATFQTAMARDVIKAILNTSNGVAEYQHVLMTLLLHKGLQDGKLLETLVKENGHIFHHLEEEENIIFVAPYLSDVRICNDYQKSSVAGECEKGNCESFHICSLFMKGICKKLVCKYSHTYSDAHNSQIKQRLHLSSYSDSEINKLLENQYPKICPQWSCLGDKTCPYLHVCQSFCTANCKYGDKCKRIHSFETDHNRWILQAYDISTKSIWSGSDLAKRLVLAKT